ncbi:MAG: gamma-glutamyltransferase, partial [Porticoccaceae bacterium]|nr:gamma-glutamyltransferase [Porticoccaceae bacterium]
IEAYGADGFYKGRSAQLIVEQMQRSGGLITLEDLANYRVVEREPVCGSYRTVSLCAMPPPSSGGVHLLQILNILEGWDLHKLGHNSAAYMHLLVESMRSAYADRSLYLGDPDFAPVPVDQLTDKKYAAILRAQIDSNKARRSSEVRPGLDNFLAQQSPESDETTHFTVWDKHGNIVSNTYTLNFPYGSGIAVDGAGFLLNNEMDDFSSKPGAANAYGLIGGVANAIAPQKRPLSSMTPTIVFDNQGEPIMATGSPGGSTIITIVLQMILNTVDFKMGIAAATAAPRIHHQWLPDTLDYESGISTDSLRLIVKMGHKIDDAPRVMGASQSISIERGQLSAAADPRRQGAGAVPQPDSL